MANETPIHITQVTIEEHDKDTIEIIYVPEQTQVLHEGRKYKFIFSTNGISLKGDDNAT